MNLFRYAKDYILEDELKIIVKEGKVNIVNYKNVIGFDNNKIIVDCNKILIIVSGNSLVISKLLLDELLISGNIEKIEFR
jgi:sporulation protein YqfC